MDKQVLIVGCGDVGSRLAASLHAKGWAVDAWAQSARQREFGRVRGVDLDKDGALPTTDATVCVYLVPPQPDGQDDRRLRRFLAHNGGVVRHLVYAGASGVYGDCDGRWVDETAALNPGNGRSRRRVDAEQQVAAWASGGDGTAVCLRLAGIYGPGRLPIARVRRGDPVVQRDQASWSNRVHVNDVVSAIESALTHGEHMQSGACLAVNVADGQPTTMTDYLQACAAAIGAPALPELPPEQVLAQASPALRGYLTQSRRLRIDRLCTVLEAPPQHTDFRQELAALATDALR